jgi:uncharacterized protein
MKSFVDSFLDRLLFGGGLKMGVAKNQNKANSLKQFRPQRVRDPLHNIIQFEGNEFENALWDVVQSTPFQRLRRIKQLGFSDFVYPGATHSRFAHSLGVFHTAKRLMKIIENHIGSKRYLETRAHAAIAAALVHDVGHGPFSHAFEKVGKKLKLKMAIHENVSDELIRTGPISEALNKLGSGFATDVASIVKSERPQNIYSAVVSSQFDADRLDYMRRDRMMTGTQHAAIDFEWLVANLEVGEVEYGVDEVPLDRIETFVLGPKAVLAAESYVWGLFQPYPTVYLHKTTRGIEQLFVELILRVVKLINDDSLRMTGLPKNHPLVLFAREPTKVESALRLDDTIVWGSLHLMAGAKDKCIAEAAQRLRDRNLYKSIDIREQVQIRLGTEGSANTNDALRVDLVCDAIQKRVKTKIGNMRRRSPGSLSPMLSDKDKREPYRRYNEDKGPLNQIRIKLPGGDLVDLGERSGIVSSIESFKLDRIYLAEKLGESRDFVERTIQEEVDNEKAKKL